VIGVAVFGERYLPPRVYRVPPPYRPYPYPRPYPYNKDYDDSYGRADGERAPSAKSGGAPAPAPSDAAPPPSASPPRDAAGESGSGAYGKGSSRSEAPYAQRNRSGLGTEYGEAVQSPIYEVEFVRANPSTPTAVLGARYNDREGLLALGIPVDSYYDQTCYNGYGYGGYDEGDLRRTADPFPVTDRRFAAPPPGWQRPCDWR
jgi:hypothetical protein